MSATKYAVSALPFIALAFVSPIAAAQDEPTAFETALSETKPIFQARLRYEGVDQTGFANDADALTYRFRAGFETGAFFDTKFLLEFDHIDDLVDDFNSTTNGNTAFPVVADPQATELNRLQLTNTSLPDTTVTLGRQRIILDDSRFVGNVGWRQNEQTFDGLRVQNQSLGELKLDFSYVNQVNRIFGDESPAGRWEGDITLVNASHPTPLGNLTGFAYFLDMDGAAMGVSSQTLGARLNGSQELDEGRLAYAVSYANQTDYGSSPFDYSADYYTLDARYTVNSFTFGGGIETLGGDAQRAFQTPLATLHKFQGWSDKFLVTPVNGVEDIYATLAYRAGDVGFLNALNLSATYHDLSADVGGMDYGSELDLVASARVGDVNVTLKFADYSSDGFATDTSKLWIQFDFAL
ncbi:hypothetical protein [Ponticaulis sp.]|uniref:hypothetical protein n=1 Tax=Ponticaulis sp. TaxID=2020902 RepID=UPI00262A66AF|nr:hypothetical protein [Ponticaulis sp.]MDF1681334.1 hypothetical protein [Ponticaulis sp.]